MGLGVPSAVCLRAADGTHLGHMAVIDARPMEARDDDVAAMRIFASRAAAGSSVVTGGCSTALARASHRGRRYGAPTCRSRPARPRAAAPDGCRRPAQGRSAQARRQPEAAVSCASPTTSWARRMPSFGISPAAASRGALRAWPRSGARGADGRLRRADDDRRPGRRAAEHVELTTYCIVSGSLTNAGKDATASAVRSVSRMSTARWWWRSPTTAAVAPTRGGTGLNRLTNRTDALGGHFEVDSPPGAGTASARACRSLPSADVARATQRCA